MPVVHYEAAPTDAMKARSRWQLANDVLTILAYVLVTAASVLALLGLLFYYVLVVWRPGAG